MQWPEPRRGRPDRLIEVEAGKAVEDVRIPFRRESAITGRVVDQFGDPVPNARIAIRTFPSPNRSARHTLGQHNARTNDIGEFRLSPVPPGRYRLTAWMSRETVSGPEFPNVDRSGFVAWPHAPSLEHAEPLVVQPGEQVSDVELQLFPTKVAKVTGTVFGVDGQPAVNASVYVGVVGPGDSVVESGQNAAAPGGRFELTLTSGVYELSASVLEPPRPGRPSGPDRRATSETMKLTVAGEPIDGLALHLAPPRTVSGRIVFDSLGQVRPPAPEAIHLYAASGVGECRFSDRQVRPDYTFTITVEGRQCQVGAGASPPWRFRSVTQADRDLTFDGVPLKAQARLDDLVITFTDRTTKLRVNIGAPKGGRAEAFLVFVFPADPTRRSTPTWGHPGLLDRTIREAGPEADDGSGVVIEGLMAGESLAVAIDPDDYDASGFPETWDVLEPFGQRVTLAEGDVRALSLTIVDLPDSPLIRRSRRAPRHRIVGCPSSSSAPSALPII